jgi:chromosome condensin MukBEF ATPase and DNA-binding subunit MukB
MANYMRKLIFGEGNRICKLCQKDQENTVFHILNGSNRMVGNYTASHNLIIDPLSEAIKLNCNVMDALHENETVLITTSEGKNG